MTISIAAPVSPQDAQGFVLSVGFTEEEAQRLGTSLERIAHALQTQLSAMLPAAQSRVAYLPPPGTRPTRPAATTRRAAEPGLLLDLERGSARINGRDISLSQREYELLTALVGAGRRPLTRGELYEIVWDGAGTAGNERVVDVTVRRLRSRLRSYGQIIRTVRGVGYRFDPLPGVRIRRELATAG